MILLNLHAEQSKPPRTVIEILSDNLKLLSETVRDREKEKENPQASILIAGENRILANRRYCFKTRFFDGEFCRSYIETVADYDEKFLSFGEQLAIKTYIREKIKICEMPPVAIIEQIEKVAAERLPKKAEKFSEFRLILIKRIPAARCIFSEKCGKWLFIGLVK